MVPHREALHTSYIRSLGTLRVTNRNGLDEVKESLPVRDEMKESLPVRAVSNADCLFKEPWHAGRQLYVRFQMTDYGHMDKTAMPNAKSRSAKRLAS